jgi:putative redox protein
MVMDGDPAGGGRDLGIRPMEALLLGMGGCTAYDVVEILEKSREAVEDCVIELDAERAEDIPKVFTKIVVRYIVSGRNLDPGKVERAVKLSAETYCSATIMLGKTAEVTHEIEIIDTAKE